MTSFYELTHPTSWATPPETFSFSRLQEIEGCPRRWQLLRSEWGDQPKFPQRPHPKAMEGQIVHAAIEKLVRALGSRGMPPIGSSAFQETIREVGFWEFFAKEVGRCNERLNRHPRSGPQFLIRTSPRQLANQAIRMFREQYVPVDEAGLGGRPVDIGVPDSVPQLGQLLSDRGALAEVRVEHPELPFVGIIDLVRLNDDEAEIVDFKTGKVKDDHQRQVLLYGVLWWRATGEAPSKVSLQYLGERRSWSVTVEQLTAAEEQLARAIDLARSELQERPAAAKPGAGCRFCPARARCEPGWAHFQAAAGTTGAGVVDVELVVSSPPSPHGFVATQGRKEASVVFDASVGRLLPALGQGVTVRLLDCVAKDDGKTFEIRPWTEVYPQQP